MNSLQIETFLAIVEAGSISRASEILFLTQPTVSYRLKSLEDELGFPLVERKKGHRNIELTLKGHAFVPIATRWMQLWQDIQVLSASQSKLPFSLSCTNSINTYLLAPLYKGLVCNDSEALFNLTIWTQDTAGIYRMVESREADIGLAFENIPSKSLLIEPLFSEKLYVVRLCADKNELRTAYHPAELDAESELFFNSSPAYQAWHDKWWSPSIRPYVLISSEALILDFMDHPRFWAVVPASVVKSFEKKAEIKAYELLYPPEDRVCYRITNRNPIESHIRSIQLFNEYMKSYMRNLSFVEPHIGFRD